MTKALTIMTAGLFGLAFISGMLGLGVAFAAVPFLSFFLPDLVNQVQPLTLLLNGLTALFATFGFARSGYPLILLGFEPKKAAGINAFAVTPPSFSALIPHLSTAKWDPVLTASLIGAGVVGAFLGARFTSLYVPSNRLKQLFGLLIVVMTAYKIYTLLGG